MPLQLEAEPLPHWASPPQNPIASISIFLGENYRTDYVHSRQVQLASQAYYALYS